MKRKTIAIKWVKKTTNLYKTSYLDDSRRNQEKIFGGFIAKAIDPVLINSFPKPVAEEIDHVGVY